MLIKNRLRNRRHRLLRKLFQRGQPLRRRPRLEELEDRRLLAAAPTLSVNDVYQLEGDSGTSSFVFTITRSGKVNQPSTVQFATAPGTATEDDDYQATSGTLNFDSGEKSKTITVPVIGDGTDEADETFFVDLISVDNGNFGDSHGIGTIGNDDTAPALPTLSINDVQLAEGNSGTTAFVFTVKRSGDTSGASSVEFRTDDGTATADNDYQAISTTLDFATDQTSQTITVQVNGDTDVELHQSFTVELFGPSNATIADGSGQGTILDDDAAPIGLISHWTADNTAVDTQGLNDGTLVSGATYATGPIGQAFRFDGVDDRVLIEDAPSLQLTRSMTIEGWVRVDSFPTSGHGLVLFRGDDRGGLDPYHLTTTPSGQIQFMVSNLTEGATSLNAAMPQGELVYVAGTLDDATGEMNLYLNGERVAQKITSVRPFGALDPESNPGIGIGNHGGYPTTPHNFPFHGLIDELKIHDVALSDAEILTNFNAVPTLSIDDASVVEGDSGTAMIVFTVTLGGDNSQSPSVHFSTYAGTATEGVEYAGASGTLTFLDDQSHSQTITVQVNGDAIEESNETFFVNLSNAMGATAIDGMGVGTILNDETSVSIDDVSATEGDERIRFIDDFVPTDSSELARPVYLSFGPDGNLYVASQLEVLRYDGETGVFIDAFISPGSGGLLGAQKVIFGPDSLVYVTSYGTDEVLRYDSSGNPLPASGKTGASFVSSGAAGLDSPIDVVFDSNGNLLVSSERTDEILRYSVTNGESLGTFVSAGDGGLDAPKSMKWGADGHLYVASLASNSVLRFHGTTGAPLPGPHGGAGTAEFVPAESGGLSGTNEIDFGPDGDLYVAGTRTNAVLRFDGTSGAFVEAIDPQGNAGLITPKGLVFGPEGNLFVGSRDNREILRYGAASQASFAVSLSAPMTETITVDYNSIPHGADPATANVDYTAVSGTVTFAPGVTQRTILVPTLDDSDVEENETFVVNLSSASGGIIQDSQGLGTIQDDDAPTEPTMHVADLDETTTLGSRGKWIAMVTIKVVDANGVAVANATVNGIWSNGASGSVTCTTDANGLCTVTKDSINKKSKSVTFTITSLLHSSLVYGSLDNDDPDGDSDGTEILILKP